LLGIWEIPLPGFVGSSSANALAEREGATGAFAKGILATLLATPCTGPFLGSTINWTLQKGSPTLTFAIFAAMGVGMGSPYLVVGAYPALIRFLPKPGAWMETFKHAMGFVLLATVVWIYFFLDPDYRVATLAIMFGIWLACWWIGRTPFTAPIGQKVKSWAIAGAICVAVTVFANRYLVENSGAPGIAQGGGTSQLGSGQSDGGTSQGTSASQPAMIVSKQFGEWLPFTRISLDELRDGGVTVLVDFTAKW
jgi:thiol:disulfide interchange protein